MNNYPITVIFGGGGFVGRYLTKVLTEKNHRLIIPTRSPFQKTYLKTQAPSGSIEFLKLNPGNFTAAKEAVKNADYVMKNGILIGCHQALKNKDVQYIHSKIKQFISKFK